MSKMMICQHTEECDHILHLSGGDCICSHWDKHICTSASGQCEREDGYWKCIPVEPEPNLVKALKDLSNLGMSTRLKPDPTCPECGHPNLVEATKRACQEPTLLDALTFICIWESERAIKQAKENPTWETCFKISLKSVFENYNTPADLQPGMPLLDRDSLAKEWVKYCDHTRQRPSQHQEGMDWETWIAMQQRDADMAWLPARDQQVASKAVKEFEEKCIKNLGELFEHSRELVSLNAVKNFIRAMAEKE